MANSSKKNLIRRLLTYLKPYKIPTCIAILLLIVTMFCSVINPYLLEIAIDKYIANGDFKGLFIIGGILISLNVMSWIISYYRTHMIAKVTNEILVNIRYELYSHIQQLSFDFFDTRPVGKILARVIGDVNALKDLFNQTIQSLVPEILTLVCVTFFMFLLNVKMALACLVLLPILVAAMSFIEIHSHKRWLIYREYRSNLNAFSHESFSGMKVVEAFANEASHAETFKEHVQKMSDSFIHAVKLNDFFWPLVDLSWGAGNVIVFFIGYHLVMKGEIQIGTLLAFCMYVGMFWRPIMNLSTFYNTLITNLSAAQRIFAILDESPAIQNKDAITGKILPAIGTIKGRVIFDHVSFSYEENVPVLEDVSFTVNPGERVALVGPTGAGKTTIVSLLSRFYEPTQGRILIDGTDIKSVDLESLRGQMGIMLQDTFLFSTSIMENIRYGRLEATDEEVIAAAKAVNAHEFIMKMEKGYDTEVNERGSRLSLGQRQLISFARALLANPRILILDEATSNIDTQTEKLVQSGIEKLLKGRTSFVIAHRLSTIRDCDKIMVINHAGIMESGTHEQLLQQDGLYAKLYEAQYRLVSETA
nr:ABC transporter ATP-binding protein [uncultured Cellulosilyticum sp.]